MALGAQNRQQMAPAQFVGQYRPDGLLPPGNYSRLDFDASVPLEGYVRMNQDAMQKQTRLDIAERAAAEAQPWALVNNVLSTLAKAQPDLARLKYEDEAQTNFLINQELNDINGLYEKAYKGDMQAQDALANFTFNKAVLERAPVEKYALLKDALNKAQLSVTNSGMVSAMNKVKLGLKTMVENLVGESNPEAATLAGVISRAVSQSREGGIQPEILEEIQNRVRVYKLNNPGSKALDLGIVDTFRQDITESQKRMREEQVYGDKDIKPRDAFALIGNLAKLIELNPGMSDEKKLYYNNTIETLLSRVMPYGQGVMLPPAPAGQNTNTQGTTPSAINRLKAIFGIP
jgi:hypothetical protein